MIYGFKNFIKDTLHDRKIIFALALNDFKAKYAGSLMGILWAFFQPLITILVMWFVFEKGLRSVPVDDVPFVLWFVPAYIPWIFFMDLMNGSVSSLYDYSFLVKKVKFRVSILPLVRVFSASMVHLFFIAFIFLVFSIYRVPFSLFFLQCFYYSFALGCFSIGMAWLLSAMAVFFKDLIQVVSVVLQIGFWATPIFWNPLGLDPFVDQVLKLNPVYYVVRGYRDSFIDFIPFWRRGVAGLYFWGLTVILFIAGAMVFKRLRPHFADEL